MNSLTNADMKNLACRIAEIESENSGVKINMYPLTNKEYTDYVVHKRVSLQTKTSMMWIPYFACGLNDLKGDIVIFIDKFNAIDDYDEKLCQFLEVIYHEIRHTMQTHFDPYSYKMFINSLEKVNRGIDYYIYHDSYAFEMDANMYAYEKTKKFLNLWNLEVYKKYVKHIEEEEKKVQLDYKKYDIVSVYDKAIKKIRMRNKLKIKGNYIEKASPILTQFLNPDGSYKKIDEMLKNDEFQALDKRIIYTILSSKSFLSESDIETMNLDELKILKESIDHTRYECIARGNLYKELPRTSKDIDASAITLKRENDLSKTALRLSKREADEFRMRK